MIAKLRGDTYFCPLYLSDDFVVRLISFTFGECINPPSLTAMPREATTFCKSSITKSGGSLDEVLLRGVGDGE